MIIYIYQWLIIYNQSPPSPPPFDYQRLLQLIIVSQKNLKNPCKFSVYRGFLLPFYAILVNVDYCFLMFIKLILHTRHTRKHTQFTSNYFDLLRTLANLWHSQTPKLKP